MNKIAPVLKDLDRIGEVMVLIEEQVDCNWSIDALTQ